VRLERQFNRPRDTWVLPADVRLIDTRQGSLLFSVARWEALKTRLLEQLARFHELEPDQMGPDRDRLRRFSATALDRRRSSACSTNCWQWRIASSGPWLHLPGHQVRLSDADEALWQALQPLFETAGFDPPWVRDLPHDEATVRLLLRKMARLGLLHQVVRDLFYTDAMIRRGAAVATGRRQPGDPGVGVSRCGGPGAQAQYPDSRILRPPGLTRRVGDRRQIRPTTCWPGAHSRFQGR
jgi:selenocysteine-specific elongation factor